MTPSSGPRGGCTIPLLWGLFGLTCIVWSFL